MTQNGDEGVDADGTDLWNRLNLEIFRTLVLQFNYFSYSGHFEIDFG
jgi:hypothetical protein